MTLSAYANLVRRNAGAAYRPLDGALQIFLNNVIAQSRLLSYIDIYFGLAFISIVGALLLWYSRSRLRSANAVTYDHPHRANHTW
jgi:DHA2 family multidrug resistance protein